MRLRAAVLATWGLRCWLCGDDLDDQGWDIDHVVPRSRGGSDDLSNLRPAHARCNRSRGAGPRRTTGPSWQL